MIAATAREGANDAAVDGGCQAVQAGEHEGEGGAAAAGEGSPQGARPGQASQVLVYIVTGPELHFCSTESTNSLVVS
jgi:hypothetical protein